ncbi:amidase [Acetobacter sp. TBRC 12305]|uniref:Amidase n=1 Tax=Acetobacter garciniae TaxID=2817435 RepID=A0A939KMQ2_9PROT|nr:amidase [Acetobacter garciniae]MBO1324805.1 amidase [Acetobacter garciniae]MBX0344496.1 amidase [Acetobacter garciniae]
MTDALWRWSATRLATAIRARDVSCVEVMTSVLGRVRAVNPRINALPEVLADAALEAARRADGAVLSGIDLPPLHGVPLSIKLNIDQQGCATSNGAVALKDRIAAHDAPVVALLRRAGAIPFARANVAEFSMRWDSDCALHGRVVNPWNAAYTAGGSSSGSAAAVACGLGPASIGNDNGGSIRYPALACGVVGLRPTPGLVPFFNDTDTAERGMIGQMTNVNGPIAREVEDARLIFSAIRRETPEDPLGIPAGPIPSTPPARTPVALFTGEAAGFTPAPRVRAALLAAARRLEAAGYVVEEVTPPCFAEAAELWCNLTYDDRHRGGFDALLQAGSPAVKTLIGYIQQHFPPRDAAASLAGFARRLGILREWRAFLARWPLLLMPVSWDDPIHPDADIVSVDGLAALVRAQSPLLATSLLGLPSVAVPVALAPDYGDGLPAGVQIVAWRYRENCCLDAATHVRAPIHFPFADPYAADMP